MQFMRSTSSLTRVPFHPDKNATNLYSSINIVFSNVLKTIQMLHVNYKSITLRESKTLYIATKLNSLLDPFRIIKSKTMSTLGDTIYLFKEIKKCVIQTHPLSFFRCPAFHPLLHFFRSYVQWISTLFAPSLI